MAKAKANFNVNGNDYIRVTHRYKDEYGKSKQKVFYGKTKKEAEAKKTEFLAQQRYGLGLKNDLELRKDNFESIFYNWLFNVVIIEVKPSTFDNYDGYYRNYVKDSILSDLLVHQIKTIHIQEFFNNIYENTGRIPTLQQISKLLRKFFNYQVKLGTIQSNPCLNAILPKQIKVKNKIEIFTKEEIAILKQSYEHNFDYFIFYFALATGMRVGEIIALNVTDIDMQDLTINVNKTVTEANVYENGEKVFKKFITSPKSDNSIRTLPIPSQIIEPLQKQIDMQKAKGLSLLFTTKTNQLYTLAPVTQTFKRLLQRHFIKPRKFHTLRHTYCSLLLLKGVPPTVVADLMGHNVEMTMEIYSHLNIDNKREAVLQLDI